MIIILWQQMEGKSVCEHAACCWEKIRIKRHDDGGWSLHGYCYSLEIYETTTTTITMHGRWRRLDSKTADENSRSRVYLFTASLYCPCQWSPLQPQPVDYRHARLELPSPTTSVALPQRAKHARVPPSGRNVTSSSQTASSAKSLSRFVGCRRVLEPSDAKWPYLAV